MVLVIIDAFCECKNCLCINWRKEITRFILAGFFTVYVL